jgi:ribonuclease VapC
MILDTSAVVAILFGEPERNVFLFELARNPRLAMSAVTFYETSLVAVGKKSNPQAASEVDDFIARFDVEVVPLGIEGARAAREAYFRFGKNYHPASLNLADCFPYSLAKARNEPLLFKGNDFLQTDITPAWRP